MININQDTAIVCFAYNRPYHTKSCLDSLLQNPLSKEFPLIVFLDGLRSEKDEKYNQLIARNVLSIEGFKDVRLIRRESNFGMFNSITSGITELFKEYKSLIIIEDDLVFGKYFLNFMYDGLKTYESNKKVASIHGYLPPIKESLPKSFFLRGADCWGWATWKDRWEIFRKDSDSMIDEINKERLKFTFNLNGSFNYMRMLEDKSKNRNNSWAICWHASCFLARKLTLYPGISLVKNIGLDNSGENCGVSPMMLTEVTNKRIKVKKIPTEVDQKNYRIYCKYFKKELSIFKRVSRKIRSNILERLAQNIVKYKFSINRRGLSLIGSYKSFEDALKDSNGYSSKVINKKVKSAIIEVIEGRSEYERDGTIFLKKPKNLEIRKLLKKYLKNDSTVCDFGGGLGGTYINNRDLFCEFNKYLVVEQKKFVRIGNELVKKYSLPITFYKSIEKVVENPDIFIISSVLTYISNTSSVLKHVCSFKPEYIIIDRTAFTSKKNPYWHLQNEPFYYEKAVNYPIRLINENDLKKNLSGYIKVYEWINDFDAKSPPHKGILFKRNFNL